jgi:hypothetical protein
VLTSDKAIEPVPITGSNKLGKICKNMAITRTGIFQYGVWELKAYGVKIPPDKQDKLIYNVYRPREVVEKSKDMFCRVPITLEHPKASYLTADTALNLTHGLTGDSVEVEERDGEMYVLTTGTLYTDDSKDYYEKYGKISAGYDASYQWQEGNYKGTPYQVVMTDIVDVNHVALVQNPRGGNGCKVLDSNLSTLFMTAVQRGNMGFLADLFKKADKTKKAPLDVVALLSPVLDGKDITEGLNLIQKDIERYPISERRELESYLKDMTLAPTIDRAIVKEAISITNEAYKELVKDNSAVEALAQSVKELQEEVKEMRKFVNDYNAGQVAGAGTKDEEEITVSVKGEGEKEDKKEKPDAEPEEKSDEEKDEKKFSQDDMQALMKSLVDEVDSLKKEIKAKDFNKTTVTVSSTDSALTSDSYMTLLKGGKK